MLQLAAASQGSTTACAPSPHDVTKRRARGKNECDRRAILHWSGAHEWRKGEAADRISRSSTKRRPLFPQGENRAHIHISSTTKKPSIFFLREEEGWRERRGERGRGGRVEAARHAARPAARPAALGPAGNHHFLLASYWLLALELLQRCLSRNILRRRSRRHIIAAQSRRPREARRSEWGSSRSSFWSPRHIQSRSRPGKGTTRSGLGARCSVRLFPRVFCRSPACPLGNSTGARRGQDTRTTPTHRCAACCILRERYPCSQPYRHYIRKRVCFRSNSASP